MSLKTSALSCRKPTLIAKTKMENSGDSRMADLVISDVLGDKTLIFLFCHHVGLSSRPALHGNKVAAIALEHLSPGQHHSRAREEDNLVSPFKK